MPADAKLQEIVGAICARRGLTLGPEVGSGAFKHTFRVTTGDGTLRALKLYKAEADIRAAREADALRRCAHTSIARIESVDLWKDPSGEYLYAIEEFLGGGTLSARIVPAALRPAAIISIATPLLDALAHIESLDLVHRDIKPDNIMFRDANTPVMVDFGLVRDLAQPSITMSHWPHGPGTPFFAPAEQTLNEKALINWRADQFSLGVTLVFCASGQRHPYMFDGTAANEVVDKVVARHPVPSQFVEWAKSCGLEPLIRMVQPWPAERYRTPDDLADAWQALLGRTA